MTTPVSSSSTIHSIEELAEQIRAVKKGLKKELKTDDIYYVVPLTWIRVWQLYSNFSEESYTINGNSLLISCSPFIIILTVYHISLSPLHIHVPLIILQHVILFINVISRNKPITRECTTILASWSN